MGTCFGKGNGFYCGTKVAGYQVNLKTPRNGQPISCENCNRQTQSPITAISECAIKNKKLCRDCFINYT